MIMAISALNSKNQDFRKVAALSEALHADAMNLRCCYLRRLIYGISPERLCAWP
ncbi:hypothetical protein CaCOL14_007416 [Colletotrichum acutatum]